MANAFKGAMFEKMPVERLPRNTFDLSHQRLTTLDMGELIPVCIIPVNPADEVQAYLSDFVRMMPMYAPIMHQIDVSFFAFYERENQLWRKFDDFFRGGDDGVTDYAKPTLGELAFEYNDPVVKERLWCVMSQSDVYIDPSDNDYVPDLPQSQGDLGFLMAPGSLYNHITGNYIDVGFWINESGNTWEELYGSWINSYMQPWDLAPFKMYQDIWNEYFRDEFISEKVEIFRDLDGDWLDNAVNGGTFGAPEITLNHLQDLFLKRNRAWEKDRFTSALQEPIAIPEVLMPSMISEVELYTDSPEVSTGISLPGQRGTAFLGQSGEEIHLGSIDNNLFSPNGTTLNFSLDNFVEIVSQIKARVSTTAGTIAQLRQRVALLEFYEQQARGGNRIKESIMINFNAVVPDYRLDRPQYLGGFKHTIGISQVLQTSSNVGAGSDYQPLGQMAGTGLSGQNGFLFKEYFPEAGYIMILANIRPRSMYTNGMPKTMQRFNRLDYYWHKLANIGDEPIFNKEVYCNQLEDDPNIANEVFGYQTRYSEYKYMPNVATGDFVTNLKDWHLARFFDKTPSLNQDFIEIQPKSQGLNRIFNYTGDDYGHFLMQLSFDIKATRVMEIYSVPRFS